MSAFSNPIILTQTNNAIVLERVPLSSTGTNLFSEKWLQDTLFANPQCLPVKEIDPHIGKLIPICTEIETGAGPADILYITPTGQIVLVETKLWRNPEARREVVAQILDYAKQLASWTYEDLARESSIATKQGPSYLINCLKSHGINEAEVVDGINRSLKAGDFLLLIVGDGIRSGAEALVGFIERYANLRFGLGLIEVAAYKLPDEGLILQPRILAKTEILQRTIIIGQHGAIELEQVATAEDTQEDKAEVLWFQSFWSEYLKTLQLDDPLQPPPAKPGKSTNIFLSMPPRGGLAWISAYIAQSTGRAGVYLTFLKSFSQLDYYYENLISQKDDIEKEFGEIISWNRSGDKIYISAPNFCFRDLKSPPERAEVIAYLADTTNRMVNAFRHRLDAITREKG